MKKLLILLAVIAVVIIGLAYKMNRDSKIKKQQYEEQLMAHNKAELLKQAKLSDADAIKILESQRWSDIDKQFYQNLISKWSDAEKIAGATARIALAEQVKDLQKIQSDLSVRQPTTQCEAVLKEQLNTAFSTEIKSFIEFMQKNEEDSKKSLEEAGVYFSNVSVIMKYCDNGKVA